MQTTTKIGHVTFVHDDEFKGDVEIRRGDVKASVPVAALRDFVAESVRFELTERVAKMKPSDLLRKIA